MTISLSRPDIKIAFYSACKCPLPMLKTSISFFILLSLLASATSFAQPTEVEKQIEQQKKELEQTKSELGRTRKKAGQLKGKEKTAIGEVKRVEEELNITEKYVKKLTNAEKTLDKQLTTATEEVRRARETLRLQRDLLAWRLREIYKYGRTRSLEFLLSSESFAQLVSRFRYLSMVAESDRELLGGFENQKLELENSEAKLRQQLAEITELRHEKEKEKGNLLALRKKRRRAVRQIQNERKSYEEAAEELERTATRIRGVLEELERRRKEELARKLPTPEWMAYSEFEKNRGSFNWPVTGSVAASFGNNKHPRFGTTTFNPGIDISAPDGTEIRAVARGRADYASWLAGLGNCIILNHGGGYYTIYAHASEVLVNVGQEVSVGQVIGRVGDSGSLKGSCLHFEVRKGKQALNPAEWLR